MRASAKYIWLIIVVLFIGGFLLAQTSGLLGRAPVTNTTAVATVNGEDILATTWYQTTQNLEQEATQRGNQGITLDERQRLMDQAYDQLVADALLRQEYRRRGITVTDDEILQAARYNPPPQLMQAPDLQTDGQFDPAKYQRFLSSPLAKQQGLLYQLEQYYRTEIPKEKLYDQVATDVYLSDEQLWRRFQDTHDSAQVALVAFGPERIADSAVRVTDDEVRAYYDTHKKLFERPGTAKVSIIMIPRSVSSADSAAVRNRALALRSRILGGEKFEDVAKAESADSGSAVNGGELPKGAKGRFVPAFENAAYALKVGEISQPVLSPFGYHLIRLDARKGDTLSMHHILLRIQQSDSAATRTDRRADSLSRIAASTDQPAKFDEAARELHIPILKSGVVEGNPLTINGQFIPSVGPWAFQGARPGETSELFDAEDGYYLARLDSLTPGGTLSLDQAKDDIRSYLVRQKKLDALLPQARNFAKVAAASSLESASKLLNMQVINTKYFTRVGGAQELAQAPEAVGAAFTLPLHTVSEPIRGVGQVVVIRVDNRVPANRAVFDSQKQGLKQQALSTLRRQRVSEFLTNLKAVAKIDDRRKQVEASSRRVNQ
ncbi:MAG TPA: peptidyl-prolyl cis-trans isomerase [Gemmatimonadaceae bacterium]|jgi:peptidyl-prolyl cis-trans isomerase D|nr:peptidyl-prolyl cis-trans isomerase [Gemmatimonadaceae bacterium]